MRLGGAKKFGHGAGHGLPKSRHASLEVDQSTGVRKALIKSRPVVPLAQTCDALKNVLAIGIAHRPIAKVPKATNQTRLGVNIFGVNL